MKNKKVVTLIAVILIVSPLLYIYTAAAANENVTLSMVPSKQINLTSPDSLAIDSTFTVSINVNNVDGLYGDVFGLSWPTDIVHVTKVAAGDFLKSAGGTTFSPPTTIDNSGAVGSLPSLFNDVAMDDNNPSGSGTLCVVTFKVVGFGSGSISITSARLVSDALGTNITIATPIPYSIPINNPTATSPTPTPTQTTPTPTPTPTSGTQEPAIHISTDKTGYNPNELVTVTASVTHNGAAVANRDVAFTIRMPNNTNLATLVDTTNSNGVATIDFRIPTPQPDPNVIFGDWSILAAVDVSQVDVTDTVHFTVGYSIVIKSVSTPTSVQRLSAAPINVTLQASGVIPEGLTLTVSILDSAQVPLGMSTTAVTTQTQGDITLSTTIFIPAWAFTGEATVYVNLLTATPDQGGVPYCPQATAIFQIT
ncbi:MAG: hypothetical protein ACQCN6_00285 [Candidatus Bathyarchaeia archaeon]|jgi:hypothetical protein